MGSAISLLLVSIPRRYAKNLISISIWAFLTSFQSLVGTLKTEILTLLFLVDYLVSIPRRYAKNARLTVHNIKILQFQSLVGTLKTF